MLLTGDLPERPLDSPHRADARRLLWHGDRDRGAGGRRIPYALAFSFPPGVLVAGIVRPPLRRLLVAPLRLPAPLAPGLIATAPRPVTVPPVAAAADGKRPLAVPAGAQVQDGDFARQHGGPPGAEGPLDTAAPTVRGFSWPFGSSASGPQNNRKPRVPAGAFPSAVQTPGAYRTPAPPLDGLALQTTPLHHPRASRGMMLPRGSCSTYRSISLRVLVSGDSYVGVTRRVEQLLEEEEGRGGNYLI